MMPIVFVNRCDTYMLPSTVFSFAQCQMYFKYTLIGEMTVPVSSLSTNVRSRRYVIVNELLLLNVQYVNIYERT